MGQASALKLACNAWIGSLTAALGQSMALAEALGVDPDLFLEAISGAAVDSAYAHVKGELIRNGDFPPSFALDGVVKDLGLMLDAARGAGVTDTVLAALLSVFRKASEDGHGAEDMAAVHAAFRPIT